MKSTFANLALLGCVISVLIGCRATSPFANKNSTDFSVQFPAKDLGSATAEDSESVSDSPDQQVQLASFQETERPNVDEPSEPKFEPKADSRSIESIEDDIQAQESAAASIEPSMDGTDTVSTFGSQLSQVGSLSIDSILQSTLDYYPAIQQALTLAEIADGQQLAANGNFDTKFKASSENTPVGFYETYRSNIGLELPTFNGGSLFGGYRQGRGDLEPWYLERNTNAGGEFKFGTRLALLRGRDIDQRRVEVWQANWQRRTVEPEIRQALIEARFVAELTYWAWVAAGQIKQLNERIVDTAVQRQDGIEVRIEAGDLAEISRTDNARTVVSRQAKLIESTAKLQQSAAKLSLFYRDDQGQPLTPSENALPDFPAQNFKPDLPLDGLVEQAIANRPELQLLGIELKQIDIAIAKAKNDLLPRLDFEFAASQDLGRPTSASAAASSSGAVFANFDEKDEFQVDASLFVNQNLQRRKARGKIRSLIGKKTQLDIKRSFQVDKITADVQQALAAFSAAIGRVDRAREGVEFAQKLSEAARDLYESGDVDLFELILREQQEITAATQYIDAVLKLFVSRAALNAAIGIGFADVPQP